MRKAPLPGGAFSCALVVLPRGNVGHEFIDRCEVTPALSPVAGLLFGRPCPFRPMPVGMPCRKSARAEGALFRARPTPRPALSRRGRNAVSVHVTVEVFAGAVALRALAARTYLRDGVARMVRLAPVAGLRPALELHGRDVRPGNDEGPRTRRMVSVTRAATSAAAVDFDVTRFPGENPGPIAGSKN